LTPAGGLDFCGGLIGYDRDIADYGHNRAFETFLEHGLISLSPARAQDASITPPLAYGAHRSKLWTALSDAAHRPAVRLSEEDRLRLTMWIDANAPYHDRFVNKRAESQPYNLPADQELAESLAAIHQRRCVSCHAVEAVTRLDWIDIHNPGSSRFLTAPLAKGAGGDDRCSQAIYSRTDDPDYRAALDLAQSAVKRLWAQPRRDVQSLARPTRLARRSPAAE
jgi:hypothetical protein